jgi:hypothetical protein
MTDGGDGGGPDMGTDPAPGCGCWNGGGCTDFENPCKDVFCGLLLISHPTLVLKSLSDFFMSASEDRKGEAITLVERAIRHYQTNMRPAMREEGIIIQCKYTPSCSEYALQAVRKYGQVRGTAMAISRLIRCSPGFAGGEDPVPDNFVLCR